MQRLGRPAIAIGLAAAAVLLLAVVATGGDVPLATEGTGGWRIEPRGLDDDERPIDQVQPLGEPSRSSRLPGEGALGILARTAVVLGGGVVLFLIGRALLRVSRRPVEPLDVAPEEHWPEPAQEMVEAIDHGLAGLAAGPVDEVVVACWVHLEEAAAAAGAARGPSETPAELAARVLEDLRAPAGATDALLARYRQARYSHHPLDEADRTVAIDALADIRAAIAGAAA